MKTGRKRIKRRSKYGGMTKKEFQEAILKELQTGKLAEILTKK